MLAQNSDAMSERRGAAAPTAAQEGRVDVTELCRLAVVRRQTPARPVDVIAGTRLGHV